MMKRWMKMGVLVFFATIGALATITLAGFLGLWFWFWAVEHISKQPTAALKQLKQEWRMTAVEER